MHPGLRSTPPYAAASLASFALIGAPLALCACVAGLVALVLGVLVVVLGTLDGQPGEALARGLSLMLAGVGGTLLALLAIGTLALFASTVVLPALALVLRLALGALRVRSRTVGIAAFVLAGQVLGLAVAAGIHLLGPERGWPVLRRPLPLVALYLSGPFLGAVATTFYGIVLLATDAAGQAARRAARSIREATARPAG